MPRNKPQKLTEAYSISRNGRAHPERAEAPSLLDDAFLLLPLIRLCVLHAASPSWLSQESLARMLLADGYAFSDARLRLLLAKLVRQGWIGVSDKGRGEQSYRTTRAGMGALRDGGSIWSY